MDIYDEKYEFLKEVERICDSFPKEKEAMDEEKMIVFMNELKSYIEDLSYIFKDQINESNDLKELHILQKIVHTKETVERHLLQKSLLSKAVEPETHSKEIKDSSLSLDIDHRFRDKTEYGEKEVNEPIENHLINNSDAPIDIEIKNKDVLLNENRKNPDGFESYPNKDKQHNTKDVEDSSCINYVNDGIEKTKEEKKNVSFQVNRENLVDGSLQTKISKHELKHVIEFSIIPMELIEEWSNQIDAYDNLIYEHTCEYKRNNIRKKIESKNKKKKGVVSSSSSVNLKDSSNENMDDELCLLAKEMKENVLTYRDILNEDNRFLEETASKQVTQLETMNDVSKKTKRMNQNKSISFFLSLIIIAISMLLFVLTFFVILFL